MKRILLAFALVSLITSANAQLAVDYSPPYDDENYLVNNILLGGGITATGVTFSGGADQIAFFDGTLSNIGIPTGIILATGDAMEAIGPNSDCCVTLGGPYAGTDPDLQAIAGMPINDAAVLEFDFVPLGDSISFRYVFASDEYNEYACSNFNDAFGFFISGPGFSGPYTGGAENIALIPGTTTPVAINTINLGVAGLSGSAPNCAAANPNWTTDNVYFVDNDVIGSGTVEYDGFTVVMEAKAAVQCGQTYHIKLAVGDASDNAFDSAVFLEGGSFSSSGVSVTAASVDGDSLMVESCEDAMFIFCRQDTSSTFAIHFDVAGTATPGVDFTALPDSIVIPQGVFCDTVVIEAFEDGIPEADEEIIVTINYDSGCLGPDTIEAHLWIMNRDPLEVFINEDQIICTDNGEFAILAGSHNGGFVPYSYLWTDATDTTIVISTSDTTTVSPATTSSYMFYVTDGCLVTEGIGPLEVSVQCDIEAPNVFSPNGDGYNEFFYIINLDQYPESRCQIFNRWGQVVYDNGNYQNDWDGKHMNSGKDVPEGVYYYIVTPNTEDLEPVSGHVTVVR